MGIAACTQPSGEVLEGQFVFVWTPDRLLLWNNRVIATAELLSGTITVSGVLGVVSSCPDSSWIWTATALFHWNKGARQVAEIRAADGSALTGITSVIVDSADSIWILTATKAFKWFHNTSAAEEITDAVGSSIAAGKVLAGHLEDIWLTNNDHLYHYLPNTKVASEIRSPSGTPLTDVQGIVVVGVSPGDVLVWNTTGIFQFMPHTDRTRQITDLTNTPISGIQGVVAALSQSSLQVFLWNGAGLFRHGLGTVVAAQVLSADGSPLQKIRGVTPAPNVEGDFDLWIWNDTQVHVLRAGATTATEAKRSDGASLSGVWAILASASNKAVWIRNETAVYEGRFNSMAVRQLLAVDGASLGSSTGGILALVVHPQIVRGEEVGALETGPWGASLVNPPIPKLVTFAGSLRGGVRTLPVGSNVGLTTITGFTDAIPFIREIGSATLLRAPSAVLVSN